LCFKKYFFKGFSVNDFMKGYYEDIFIHDSDICRSGCVGGATKQAITFLGTGSLGLDKPYTNLAKKM
jgi:hypothetical protein